MNGHTHHSNNPFRSHAIPGKDTFYDSAALPSYQDLLTGASSQNRRNPNMRTRPSERERVQVQSISAAYMRPSGPTSSRLRSLPDSDICMTMSDESRYPSLDSSSRSSVSSATLTNVGGRRTATPRVRMTNNPMPSLRVLPEYEEIRSGRLPIPEDPYGGNLYAEHEQSAFNPKSRNEERLGSRYSRPGPMPPLNHQSPKREQPEHMPALRRTNYNGLNIAGPSRPSRAAQYTSVHPQQSSGLNRVVPQEQKHISANRFDDYPPPPKPAKYSPPARHRMLERNAAADIPPPRHYQPQTQTQPQSQPPAGGHVGSEADIIKRMRAVQLAGGPHSQRLTSPMADSGPPQPEATYDGLGPHDSFYDWETAGKGRWVKDESRSWWKGGNGWKRVGGRKRQKEQISRSQAIGLLAATGGVIDERIMAYLNVDEEDDNADFMGLG